MKRRRLFSYVTADGSVLSDQMDIDATSSCNSIDSPGECSVTSSFIARNLAAAQYSDVAIRRKPCHEHVTTPVSANGKNLASETSALLMPSKSSLSLKNGLTDVCRPLSPNKAKSAESLKTLDLNGSINGGTSVSQIHNCIRSPCSPHDGKRRGDNCYNLSNKAGRKMKHSPFLPHISFL